jgi:hypothetical protein
VSEEFVNPYDTPEYQAFVESMVKHCCCEYDKPCEGVLSGGLCDRKTSRRDFDTYEWSEMEKYDE